MAGKSSSEEQPRTVEVVGERVVTVATDAADSADRTPETTTRTMGFECSSGDWVEGSWTGVDVADLVDAAGTPDDTTHLVVESDDGYRGCVAIDACLDGLLALAGEVDPEASDRDTIDQAGFPRLVAPGLYGPRAVKNVVRLEPVVLAPGENPEGYEDWQLEEKESRRGEGQREEGPE